jgi:hypothetical protein
MICHVLVTYRGPATSDTVTSVACPSRKSASVCSAMSQAHTSVRCTLSPNQVVSSCVPGRAPESEGKRTIPSAARSGRPTRHVAFPSESADDSCQTWRRSGTPASFVSVSRAVSRVQSVRSIFYHKAPVECLNTLHPNRQAISQGDTHGDSLLPQRFLGTPQAFMRILC